MCYFQIIHEFVSYYKVEGVAKLDSVHVREMHCSD